MLMMTYQTFSKIPRNGRKKNPDYNPQDPSSHQWLKLPPREQDFIARWLDMKGYNVLVCDEAQALKNYSSNTSKTVQFFLGADGEKALLLMTGTPAHNNLLDTFGLIKLMTPGKYASKRSFERIHCIYTTNDNGWSQLIGFQNKDVLHRALYAQARRVTKDQVLNLKAPHIVDRTISLSPEHHRLYEKLVRERMLEVGDGLITALTQQKLRESCLQIVTTPERFTDDKVHNSVFEEVEELLDEIGTAHEKVVLFATHQDTVRSLAEKFSELNPITVYGGNGSGKKNRANIEIFKTDPDCRLAVMHPESGGVGLNLQDVCRYMIFVEPFSVPGQFKQACDRIHRGEIKHVVTFYILKVRGTLGPKMIRDMLNKEKDIMYVTKDAKSVLSDLLGE
jgi:SNF2 family DNA or RNA helicase